MGSFGKQIETVSCEKVKVKKQKNKTCLVGNENILFWMCVCECVREKERERESERERVCLCVCLCVCESVRCQRVGRLFRKPGHLFGWIVSDEEDGKKEVRKQKPNISRRRFHQHLFARTRWEAFFGKRRLANGVWQTAHKFGKLRTDLANFVRILAWYSRLNFSGNGWWNWMVNFLPKAVRRRIVAWQKKFGEIDPGGDPITEMLSWRGRY